MFKERLTITRDDSTLTKLCKFCAWMGIICCFILFAIVWIIFFVLLGGPTIIYKLFCVMYKHHLDKEQTRKEYENDIEYTKWHDKD